MTTQHVHVLLGYCYGLFVGLWICPCFVEGFVAATSVYTLLVVSFVSWRSLAAYQLIYITDSIVYMATHEPSRYRFSTTTYIALYVALLTAYYIFDTSMAQKSRFRMLMQGTYQERWTFPQLPWGTLKDPKYIQTEHGNRLLVSGWWAYARKPNYSADLVMSLTWGLVIGAASPIPYFYPLFFVTVLTHRCGRDFERCAIKYGKDWERYCAVVPYRFIPYVY